MSKAAFEPCIPTRGTTVPTGEDWLHEIKHDGYRLIVQRDGQRVRLFTRNGHDWSGRFPLITEAALRNRNSSFVLDGEAVPAGGLGIAKQLKDEIFDCPPVLVLTGRPQDAWLATWSRAEAAVPHPLDPIQLAETAVALLRSRVPAPR